MPGLHFILLQLKLQTLGHLLSNQETFSIRILEKKKKMKTLKPKQHSNTNTWTPLNFAAVQAALPVLQTRETWLSNQETLAVEIFVTFFKKMKTLKIYSEG